MDDRHQHQAEYPIKELSQTEELEVECAECAAIREDMSAIYEADGLTFTRPDE